jgi:hypothetical protein
MSWRRLSSDVGETETGGGVGDLKICLSSLQQEWVDSWADMMVELVWLMGRGEGGECDSLLQFGPFYSSGDLTGNRS